MRVSVQLGHFTGTRGYAEGLRPSPKGFQGKENMTKIIIYGNAGCDLSMPSQNRLGYDYCGKTPFRGKSALTRPARAESMEERPENQNGEPMESVRRIGLQE